MMSYWSPYVTSFFTDPWTHVSKYFVWLQFPWWLSCRVSWWSNMLAVRNHCGRQLWHSTVFVNWGSCIVFECIWTIKRMDVKTLGHTWTVKHLNCKALGLWTVKSRSLSGPSYVHFEKLGSPTAWWSDLWTASGLWLKILVGHLFFTCASHFWDVPIPDKVCSKPCLLSFTVIYILYIIYQSMLSLQAPLLPQRLHPAAGTARCNESLALKARGGVRFKSVDLQCIILIYPD